MKKLIIAVFLVVLSPIVGAVGVAGTVASVDTGLSNGVVTFGLGLNPLPNECNNKYHFNNRDDLLASVLIYSFSSSRLNEALKGVEGYIPDPSIGKLSITLDAAAQDGIINTCTITRAATTN